MFLSMFLTFLCCDGAAAAISLSGVERNLLRDGAPPGATEVPATR
jgi:hypothetical protein